MQQQKQRPTPQARFIGGRNFLLTVAAFSAINVFLGASEAGITFLFGASLPQIIMLLTDTGMGLLFGFLTMGVYFLCWWLSKKHPGWLLAAAILFSIDTILTIVLILRADLGSSLLNLAFHTLALISMFRGASAGLQLKDDDISTEEVIENRTNYIMQNAGGVRQFTYNKEFAKQHGARKTGKYVLLFLLFFVLLMTCGLSGMFASLELELASTELLIIVTLLLCVAIIVVFTILLAKTEVYVTAPMTTFFLNEAGQLGFHRSMQTVILNDLKVVNAYDECYEVVYTRPNGKPKKLTIPNAYPELEWFLDEKKAQQ